MSYGQQIWQIPEQAPDYARIAVLQTERGYLNSLNVRSTATSERIDALNALIQKELNID